MICLPALVLSIKAASDAINYYSTLYNKIEDIFTKMCVTTPVRVSNVVFDF